MKCKCIVEEKTGWTEVKCCNNCGKSIEDFWTVPELIENEKLSATVDLMRSIINKFINVENPTYTEAELLIINDSSNMYMDKLIEKEICNRCDIEMVNDGIFLKCPSCLK